MLDACTDTASLCPPLSPFCEAFQVGLPGAESNAAAVTFLDTPGHAAFKSMRQSGSNTADVIVLVIAADDGVSAQTEEIIDTFKAMSSSQPGSVTLMVVMSKIDKPGIDADHSAMKIENQLLEHGIMTEGVAATSSTSTMEDYEHGPPVQLVPVSGITGEGLSDLIEGLVLQSEVMDLRADVDARAEGIVIDARMERGLGVVADCIIRWGKLERGDYVLSGMHGGKVRIVNDVNNQSLKRAGPSQPVRIVGLKSLPKSGDPIVCVESELVAKDIIARREALEAKRGASMAYRTGAGGAEAELIVMGTAAKTNSMVSKQWDKYGFDAGGVAKKDSGPKRIPVIIKADADGSLEAVRDSLLAVGDNSSLDFIVDPVGLSIGQVTESDVQMASVSGAAIFTFNIKNLDRASEVLAEKEGVKIRSHDVIYSLLDDAKEVFSTYFPPIPKHKVQGKAAIKAVFDINNGQNRVAGLIVQEGSLHLDRTSADREKGIPSLECKYRVKRKGKMVSEGEALHASSLKHVKEEVKEVKRGLECGLVLGEFFDLQEGDVIECYTTEMEKVFV